MIEVTWNGRGGQGAFTAARILGAAWALKGGGGFALAFPSFGPERRGAPVRAFVKLDGKKINNRSEIRKSDFAVYLDGTLFDESALPALKDGGKIIVNTARRYSDARVIAVDAGQIAGGILKKNIVNTAMLGVLSAVCPDIGLDLIEKSIVQIMPERLIDGNIAVVRAAEGAV